MAPPSSVDFRRNLESSAKQVEDRASKRREAHFSVAQRWEKLTIGLGLAAAFAGVVGGGGSSAIGSSVLAGVFGTISGLLAAAIAFLKPGDTASSHKRA